MSNAVTIRPAKAWGWVDFTFPTPVSVNAGTVWIGYIAGDPTNLTQMRYDAVTGDLKWNVNAGGYPAGASNHSGQRTQPTITTRSTRPTRPGRTTRRSPTITTPSSTLTWKVGDTINFSGGATDSEDGTLPASGLSWLLILNHCDPTGQSCHVHQLQTFTGVSSGSFDAPDHGYPSNLELRLTATDSQGLSSTTSVTLQPQTVDLTFSVRSVRPATRLRRRHPGDPVHGHRDHRLDPLDQRAGARRR